MSDDNCDMLKEEQHEFKQAAKILVDEHINFPLTVDVSIQLVLGKLKENNEFAKVCRSLARIKYLARAIDNERISRGSKLVQDGQKLLEGDICV